MIPLDARVYVVDDDASFVRSALRLLGSWGVPAEGFTSGVQLLARAPYGGCACALVDLRMPGVNGLDLQEALRRAGWALPVVLISGHTDEQSVVDAMRSGAVAFLTKPVDERRLLAALDLAFAAEVERTSREPSEGVRTGMLRLVEWERLEGSAVESDLTA